MPNCRNLPEKIKDINFLFDLLQTDAGFWLKLKSGDIYDTYDAYDKFDTCDMYYAYYAYDTYDTYEDTYG